MIINKKKLILMRGLPGSGKTLFALKLVGDGIIHSTDDFLIKDGKYVFDKDNICRYHRRNLVDSINSMTRGISPIIIDNTNIIAEYCKEYVKYGKIFGYDIEVVEVDTPWAFDIEELIKRNTHDVPRETIEDMLRIYEKLSVFKRKLGIK